MSIEFRSLPVWPRLQEDQWVWEVHDQHVMDDSPEIDCGFCAAFVQLTAVEEEGLGAEYKSLRGWDLYRAMYIVRMHFGGPGG